MGLVDLGYCRTAQDSGAGTFSQTHAVPSGNISNTTELEQHNNAANRTEADQYHYVQDFLIDELCVPE